MFLLLRKESYMGSFKSQLGISFKSYLGSRIVREENCKRYQGVDNEFLWKLTVDGDQRATLE